MESMMPSINMLGLGSNSSPYPPPWTSPSPHLHHSPPKLIHVLFVRIHRKRQRSFNDLATGVADIGVDGLLDGTVGVVEHDDCVAPLKLAFREGPSDLLEGDHGGGGGVADEGDFIVVVGIDEVLDQGS